MKKDQLYPKRKINYEELKTRKLQEFYVIIHLVTLEMFIGEGNLLEKSKINFMYGLDIHGRKSLIGLYIEDKENNRYWLNELEKIKKRGLKKVLYVAIESNRRLEQAFKIVYNPIIKYSINEEVARIAKYTQYKWKATGEQELVHAYLAENEQEYNKKIDALKEKYKENHIGLMLIKEFEEKMRKHIKEESVEVRHLVCSYTTKRRIKQELSRLEKQYSSIKNLEEFVEVNADYLGMFERTRIYAKEKWTRLLNEIYRIKYEEIKEYI